MERENVARRVNAAPFASLILDGATDVAIMEQDIVFVRTCKGGVVSIDFLSLQTTPKSDAAGIQVSVVRAVESGLGVSMTELNAKFVAIATDGAAVMTGRKAGVVALMKQAQPSLVGVHCFSHRLELACRDIVKAHSSYQEMDKFLLDVYLFYHNR